MLTLYVKTGCPFCAKVLEAGKELGIDFVIKNVADAGVVEELVAKGGKRQTPYFIDEEHGMSMYGSDEIVNHLREHHGKEDASCTCGSE